MPLISHLFVTETVFFCAENGQSLMKDVNNQPRIGSSFIDSHCIKENLCIVPAGKVNVC